MKERKLEGEGESLSHTIIIIITSCQVSTCPLISGLGSIIIALI